MAMEPSSQRRFGKYILLDLIATGGMAEIYLAKLSGEESFERMLAIKCIRPELAKDETFAEMFANEARLAGQFSHPNLVQIFELGRVEEQLYIAMELVEGRDLRNIIDRAKELDKEIPVAFAAHVIRQAAEGLDYAHRKLGADGAPIGLVHRDVSPQNLIVAWQGAVKVIDFGIAKAADGAQTQVGILKGKFDYLAPEQMHGKKLDRRVDIFALGNVLYETVTGTKMYGGDNTNDFDVLNRAKNADIPDFAAELPEAPVELIEVLTQACAAQPKNRFAWASEMAKAMDPLLIEDRSIFGAAEAATFLEELYSDERETDRAKAEAALRSAAVRDAAADEDAMEFDSKTETFMSAFGGTSDLAADLAAIKPAEIGMPGAFSIPGGAPAMPGAKSSAASGGMALEPPLPAAAPPSRSRQWFAVYIVAGALVLGAAAGWFLGSPDPAASSAAGAGGTGAVPVAAPESAPQMEASPESEPTEFGFLKIKVRRGKGAKVFLDDEAVGRALRKPIKVPVGAHSIRVVRGAKTKERTVTVGIEHTKNAPAAVVIPF